MVRVKRVSGGENVNGGVKEQIRVEVVEVLVKMLEEVNA